MPNTRIQFAVVREDPEVELVAVQRLVGSPPARAVLVASGGCTALSLQSAWPATEFTLVDPNPSQLELVERKVACLAESRLEDFVGCGPRDLCQCGKFEGLFRGLRRFVEEFVAAPDEIEQWFTGDADVESAFANPYWPVAFEMFLGTPLLETMFGPDATQHAEPDSYPGYFRARLEAGLRTPEAATNYFLHHIFLGRYSPPALPRYLSEPPQRCRFEYRNVSLQDVEDLRRYDLVDLSNVMDWMAERDARLLVERLAGGLREGAVVLWRQLNNRLDRERWFGARVAFDRELGRELVSQDRSLFYESIHVGVAR